MPQDIDRVEITTPEASSPVKATTGFVKDFLTPNEAKIEAVVNIATYRKSEDAPYSVCLSAAGSEGMVADMLLEAVELLGQRLPNFRSLFAAKLRAQILENTPANFETVLTDVLTHMSSALKDPKPTH